MPEKLSTHDTMRELFDRIFLQAKVKGTSCEKTLQQEIQYLREELVLTLQNENE